MRPVLELLVPGLVALPCSAGGRMPRACGLAAYLRDGYGALRKPKIEYGCEILFFCGMCCEIELLALRLHRNHDLVDRIFTVC